MFDVSEFVFAGHKRVFVADRVLDEVGFDKRGGAAFKVEEGSLAKIQVAHITIFAVCVDGCADLDIIRDGGGNPHRFEKGDVHLSVDGVKGMVINTAVAEGVFAFDCEFIVSIRKVLGGGESVSVGAKVCFGEGQARGGVGGKAF